jgi:hypothetical protein
MKILVNQQTQLWGEENARVRSGLEMSFIALFLFEIG